MDRLSTPRALLLDFGGVVVSTKTRPEWMQDLAEEIHDRFEAIGCAAPSLERIRLDVMFGAEADSRWKDAMSRPGEPVELTHRQFWADFVAADWPAPARAWVIAEATALCARMGQLRQVRTNRTGLVELLDTADSRGIPVGVVSNALSGAVHREHLRLCGLDRRLAVQVYSDEVGIRKPHPGMILMAAGALGVSAADAWYVGDNFDRDVLCARRAGAGAAILMEDKDTYERPYLAQVEPDAVVSDPAELRELLLSTCRDDDERKAQ